MKNNLLILFIAFSLLSNAQSIFFEDFENVTSPALPTNISAVDQDGDGYNWTTLDASTQQPWTNNGQIAMSESFNNTPGAITPDNRLIIGPIDMSSLSGNFILEWDAGATETTASGWYQENYSVYV